MGFMKIVAAYTALRALRSDSVLIESFSRFAVSHIHDGMTVARTQSEQRLTESSG